MHGPLLWCDAEANFQRLCSPKAVEDIIAKAKHAGILTLIVDVKPLIGEVLYDSTLAPRFRGINGQSFPENFDLLGVFINEAKRKGIHIHAAINVLSEGCRVRSEGPALIHPDWQVTTCEFVWTAKIGQTLLKLETLDPLELPDKPVLYTRKSGVEIRGNTIKIAIEDDTVVSVGLEPTPIPENGCVLSIPLDEFFFHITVGDKVTWEKQAVLRNSSESAIPSYSIFADPIGPAREYELEIVRELVSLYEVEGIVFDRMRYPNLYADFGVRSQQAFERWLGCRIRWPDDIFMAGSVPWSPILPGKFFNQWLEWRAWQIRDFAEEAITVAKRTRPGITVGVYVGSWYESYYEVGVNWASSKFNPGYWWMTPTYHRTGFAELFDYICVGCYYKIPTRVEARKMNASEKSTVEAGCDVARAAINHSSLLYGSLYLKDYFENPEGFQTAVVVAQAKTDGVMLFDLVYVEDYRWWPLLEKTLRF